MSDWKNEAEAREQIRTLVAEYFNDFKKPEMEKPFSPGDRIAYASRVYDEKEMCALVDAALDFWLTTGRFSEQFERAFAAWIGVKYAHLVNSGSSANLLAFMALTAPELGERRIRRGDEVITVACGFPTTVTPMLQYGAVPVFVDVTVPQYNIDVTKLEGALSEKTKAVMIAHTLGNPFDIKAVRAFCQAHNLWLVEDNCDALGTKYTIDGETRFTGAWGDIGTSSFYPPHHMTMGEGGCVYTNNPLLHRLILSYRDWGRDCVCPSGHDNLCGHRFDGQFGELPRGYDHKYVYSHFGYNLKATDTGGSPGQGDPAGARGEQRAQLVRLHRQRKARKRAGTKRGDALYRGPQHPDAAAFQRQPDQAPLLRFDSRHRRLSGVRCFGGDRIHHAQFLLGRGLSRHDG